MSQDTPKSTTLLTRVGFFLLGILAIAGLAGVYYWRRITALPAAYTESAPGGILVDATDASVLRLAREEIVQTVNEQIAQQPAQAEAEVVLDRQDVSNLVVSTIARQPQGEQWLQATQGVYTEVRDRTLEVGTVANLSDLPLETLSTSQQAALDRVLQTFPFLRDRPVYLGLEGQVSVQDGRVQLAENTRVKIGNFTLSLADLAQRLNIPPERLQQEIALQIGQLYVRDIELGDEGVILRGAIAR